MTNQDREKEAARKEARQTVPALPAKLRLIRDVPFHGMIRNHFAEGVLHSHGNLISFGARSNKPSNRVGCTHSHFNVTSLQSQRLQISAAAGGA